VIVSFSVENFRSIKERVTISFEPVKGEDNNEHTLITFEDKFGKKVQLLKLAAIFGANASGKTNIIKAISFINSTVTPFHDSSREFNIEPFGLYINAKDKNSKFDLEFYQNGKKFIYELHLNKKRVEFEKLSVFDSGKSLVFERFMDDDNQLRFKFGPKLKLDKNEKKALEINTLPNNTLLGAISKINLPPTYLSEAAEWIKCYSDLGLEKDSNNLEKLKILIRNNNELRLLIPKLINAADFNIKEVIIENILAEKAFNGIQSIELTKPDIDLKFTHKNADIEYILNSDDESSGTMKYLELTFFINPIKDKYFKFLVDEIDRAMHPDLLTFFLLNFVKHSTNSQLIFTTHSRELLNETELLRRDSIWFTERSENGGTSLFCLSDFDKSKVKNAYKSYKSGALGGTPYLKNLNRDVIDEL
jgi:AAA15 family ATPase/GTPase